MNRAPCTGLRAQDGNRQVKYRRCNLQNQASCIQKGRPGVAFRIARYARAVVADTHLEGFWMGMAVSEKTAELNRGGSHDAYTLCISQMSAGRSLDRRVAGVAAARAVTRGANRHRFHDHVDGTKHALRASARPR